MTLENLELKIALNRMEFLRLEEKLRLAALFTGLGELENLGRPGLEELLKRPLRTRMDFHTCGEVARRASPGVARGDFFLLEWGRPPYPADLGEISDPPFLLWGRGRVPGWGLPALAVVGTRSPTEGAKRAAFDFAHQAAGLGFSVVSGLARGIDTQAHRGAVEAGGTTWAVLGQGIDWVFPGSNRSLARRILASGGCLLSEYGPGEGAHPYRFVARNRIISGLCQTVMVVQAPQRSGALITADFALDQGRDVVVHPLGLEGERGAGCRALADQGAPVVSSVLDLGRGDPKNGEMKPSPQQKELPWEDAQ